MNETPWREEIGSLVRTSQIIVAALITGAVVFLGVAGVLVLQGAFDGNDEMRSVMNLVLVLFLVSAMIARMIVPGLLVTRARRQIAAGQWSPPTGAGATDLTAFFERTGDAGRLMAVFQMRTITAAALLEGVAFFASLVFMMTQSLIGLAVATVMIFGLMLHFPTRASVTHWIEDQLTLVDLQRSHPSA